MDKKEIRNKAIEYGMRILEIRKEQTDYGRVMRISELLSALSLLADEFVNYIEKGEKWKN